MTTDNDQTPRDEATNLAHEKALAESIARRDESLAFVAMQNAPHDQQGYEKLAKDALKEASKSRQHAEEVGAKTAPIDMEGTPSPLSDSMGNFAANAEVAATGGTGIKASNTDVDTGKPATTPEQAGEAVTEDAQKVIGNEPVGKRGK